MSVRLKVAGAFARSDWSVSFPLESQGKILCDGLKLLTVDFSTKARQSPKSKEHAEKSTQKYAAERIALLLVFQVHLDRQKDTGSMNKNKIVTFYKKIYFIYSKPSNDTF
jgi:hypothetical protein